MALHDFQSNLIHHRRRYQMQSRRYYLDQYANWDIIYLDEVHLRNEIILQKQTWFNYYYYRYLMINYLQQRLKAQSATITFLLDPRNKIENRQIAVFNQSNQARFTNQGQIYRKSSSSKGKTNKFNYLAHLENIKNIEKTPLKQNGSQRQIKNQDDIKTIKTKNSKQNQTPIFSVQLTKQKKKENSIQFRETSTQTEVYKEQQTKADKADETYISSERNSSQYVHRSAAFFCGDVLDDQEDYKLFLTSKIQQSFKAKIKRTPLLFAYHPKRAENLHPFIDGISPFVLLVKTSLGYHIAAISEGQLSHRKHEQKRGWIISLTNRKVYASLPGKSAISYDQVYLIFGNQQLRIEGSSLSMTSSFGMHAGYYESKGDKQSNLFGEQSREIELQSFQIFKIQFV